MSMPLRIYSAFLRTSSFEFVRVEYLSSKCYKALRVCILGSDQVFALRDVQPLEKVICTLHVVRYSCENFQ